MYREILKPKEKPAFIHILYILGIVIGIVAVASIATVIQRNIGVYGLEYVVYVLLILLGIWIYKKRLVHYKYTIIDNDILVEKTVGKRPRHLATINVKQIVEMGREGNIKEMCGNAKKIRFTFKRRSDETFYIIYRKNKKMYRGMFNLSNKFITLLEQRFKQNRST